MRPEIRGLIIGALWSVMLLAGAREARAMGEVGTATFAAGENSAMSAVMDSTGTYGYFGTAASAAVVKVRLSDMVVISTISALSDQLISGVIESSNTFAYFGSSTTPGIVTKLDVSSGVFVSSASVVIGENGLASVVIDSAGAFAYFGTNTSPGIVVKIRTTNLSESPALTLGAGESFLSCAVIDKVNGVAYFGTNTAPGKIIKVNLTTFTKAATLTLQNGENYLTSAVISTGTGVAYFGTNTAQGRVIQVRLSDFTEQPSLFLKAGEGFLTSLVLDPLRSLLYFGTNASPGQIIRIQLSNFVETFTSVLATGENAMLSALIDPASDHAYFGAGTSPGQVIKIDMLDTRTGPPIIVSQPGDANASPGGSASFSVAAVGSTPFTYQWTLNGVPIAGATGPTYTTGALGFADDQTAYACIVTNVFGSTTSRSAAVTVIPVIKVFPNPWRSDRHTGLPLTFDGAAPNSTLKIFTLSMHWVKSVTGGGAVPLTWDMTNDAGQRVASGYYFFLVETHNAKQTVHGRFAIIK